MLWQALAQLSKILLISIYKADPDSHSREYLFTGSVAGLVADIVFCARKRKLQFLNELLSFILPLSRRWSAVNRYLTQFGVLS